MPDNYGTLVVRFEELEEDQEVEEIIPAGDDESSDLPTLNSHNDETISTNEQRQPQQEIQQQRKPPSASALRVFTVSGRVESDLVEVGQDPETEDTIYQERLYISCEPPPVNQIHGETNKLPFIARITVSPNGETFAEKQKNPVLFIAHDPVADACLPSALPVCLLTAISGPDGKPGENVAAEMFLRIVGRNLYRGPQSHLAARLRFGSSNNNSSSSNHSKDEDSNNSSGSSSSSSSSSNSNDNNVIPLSKVQFDRDSASITGMVPVAAISHLGVGIAVSSGIASSSRESSKQMIDPPARAVVVEVSIDGEEYFSVPERLTLYREVPLMLQGSGFVPAAEGIVMELVPMQTTFRGQAAKVSICMNLGGIRLEQTMPAVNERLFLWVRGGYMI